MNSIVKASENDSQLLADMGKITFIESHGSSALAADIKCYVDAKYTPDVFKTELKEAKNYYHISYRNEKAAGFSNLILNAIHPTISLKNICKLDRLYLLKEFYNQQLGKELFEFNIEFSKKNEQTGMWLFVWIENHRAVKFYKNRGFEIIGTHDFKISETHSNPNYQMLLKY